MFLARQLLFFIALNTLSSCAYFDSSIPITDLNTATENRFLQRLVPACPRIFNKKMSSGAGVLISRNGYIITDLHVTDVDDTVTVVFYRVNAKNNNFIEPFYTTTGKVMAWSDPAIDWSLVKIEQIPQNVNPLPLAPDGSLDHDQPVWRFGYNTTYHFSYGYYVAKNAGVEGDDLRKQMILNSGPGSSGGPVINNRGEVLGLVQLCAMGKDRLTIINGKRQTYYDPATTFFLHADIIRILLNQAIKDNSLALEGF